MAQPGPALRDLVEDGALRAEVDPALLPLLDGWLPLGAAPPPDPASAPAALLRITAMDAPAGGAPEGPPAFRFGQAEGWVEPGGGVVLRTRRGAEARVALDAARAEVRWPATAPASAAAADLHDAATLAAGLLLGRLGRLLVHAAAAAPPGGGAWLLVGDSRAGKSSTCTTLAAAGWEYLSDDHCVLARDGNGAPRVEGWPRAFNLDPGWEARRPTGGRAAVDPRARWPGRGRRRAALAGVLFPAVQADRPTALLPLHGADALGRLVRAAPWLFFDAARAPALLELLRQAAAGPAFALRLGLDTYADPDALRARLGPLFER